MKNHKLVRVDFYDYIISKRYRSREDDDDGSREYGSILISEEFPQVYGVLNLNETGNPGGFEGDSGNDYIRYFFRTAGYPPYKRYISSGASHKMEQYHRDTYENNDIGLTIATEETDLDAYKDYSTEIAYTNPEYDSLLVPGVSPLRLLIALAEKEII